MANPPSPEPMIGDVKKAGKKVVSVCTFFIGLISKDNQII
jgi:hypothetical protein